MIQDPTRLSTLLESLRQYTGDESTIILVRNNIPIALVAGINAKGDVRFYSSADSFTRTIAEAHDAGRLIAAKNLEKKGEPHDATVPVKPGDENKPATPNRTSQEAAHPVKSAASLVPLVAALKQVVGPLSALASRIIEEMTIAAQTAAAKEGVIGCLPLSAVVPQMIGAMEGAKSKIEDAISAIGENENPTNYLQGAVEIIDSALTKIYE